MKYALIALIAIYLVTYGCSPDDSEKATDSHEQAAPVTLEIPQQGEEVAPPTDLHESAPAHAEQKQTADAVEKAIIVEETTVAAEVAEEKAAEEERIAAEVKAAERRKNCCRRKGR